MTGVLVRLLTVLALTAALVVQPWTAPEAPAAEPCASETVRRVAGGALGESTPVLFVHGINSDATTWNVPERNPITHQIAAKVGETSVWTFDYRKAQPAWVTDQRIGPALAEAISCLSRASGARVVVVAHSMGGLATQLAVSEDDPRGGKVGDRVAEVITLGTPFRGSRLLSMVRHAISPGLLFVLRAGPASAVVLVGLYAILGICAGDTGGDGSRCSLISVPESAQAEALEFDSDAITALPPWPEKLPVFAIAGDIWVRGPLGDAVPAPWEVGDIAVTLDSATAHSTAGSPFVVRCEENLLDALNSPCAHTELQQHPAIIDKVVERVRRIVDGPSLAWATTGEVRVRHPSGEYQIATIPPGAQAVQLAWSGSGRRLAWVTERPDGRQRLFLADTEDRVVRSWDCGWCQPIAFHGETLLSAGSGGGDFSMDLLAYPDDGGAAVPFRITGLPPIDFEQCTGPCGVGLLGGTGDPEGLIITYTALGGGNFGGVDALYRVDSKGEAHYLAAAEGSGPPTDLAVSPDGRRLAYLAFTHLGACAESTSAAVVDLDDGDSAESVLPDGGREVQAISAWFDSSGTAYGSFAASEACDTPPAPSGVRVFREEAGRAWTAVPDSALARAYTDNGWAATLVGERRPGTLMLSRRTASFEIAKNVTAFAWGPRR
ncbi:esterase/lipase family protein [Amycolatopsis taiwanensis]|uniref:AB hydrolase-1 domain-containing protein n=1 Tax=Amycolatopsis taiwanensis TaxID=342230 RepID=A0A9W6RAW3_9PSEU|nr:alpha/beta fold hydrolase [Amycolatopsis taiwanensis]GLY70742.1 hypothetical protein Atai01_73610 [Amycolatopsis taiwanensis]